MRKIKFNKDIIIYFSLFFLLSVMHLLLLNKVYDDTYIHFRIAENFVNFGVPYFNIAEPYMSSSASLWTIFVAGLYFVFSDSYINFLALINSAFIVLSLVFFEKIIEKEKKLKLIEKFVLILSFISIIFPVSYGLMETAFAIFLVSVSLYLFSKNNLYGFAFLSLAVFLRLEIVILYFLFFAYFYYVNKEKAIQILFISALASLPLILYNLYFFETLIPLTVQAKSLVYELSVFSTAIGIVPSLFFHGIAGKAFYFTLLVTVIVFFIKKHKNNLLLNQPVVMIFFVYGVLLIVAYILKGTFVHEWYKPLYLLPITLYIVTLISKIEKNHVYILALLLMIPFYRSFLTHLNYTFTDKISKPAARVNQYLDIADKLFKKYPNEVLLTSEIGGLGYAFRGRILDGMGLIQPDCLKYHPMAIPEERSNGAIGAIPTRCVEEQMPGIIVSYDVFIQHFSKQPLSTTKYNVYKLNNFKREHMKLYKDTNMWGSKNLNVYIKKDIDEGL